jgi:hypothetical protein
VTVNGKPVKELMALRTGDQVGFGAVVAKFVATEPTKTVAGSSPLPPSAPAAFSWPIASAGRLPSSAPQP